MKKQKTLEWLVKNLDVWPKTQKLAPNIDGYRWCKAIHDDVFLFDDTNVGTLEDLTIYKSEWLAACLDDVNNELNNGSLVKELTVSISDDSTKECDPVKVYENYDKQTKEQLIDHVNDQVKNPKHYQIIEGFESITVIASALTIEQWTGFCIGNILKYRIRAGKKGDLQQDIDKADFYEELYEQHKHLCKV